MSFTESRSVSVKVSSTPSFFFGNLVSCADGLAYAHVDQVAILRASAWDARTEAAGASLEVLPATRPGVAVTSLAWLPARDAVTSLLAVTTHDELLIYKAPGSGSVFVQQPYFTAALDTLPDSVLGSRAPSAHFFRGLAAAGGGSLLYAGTSWGDALAWSMRSTNAAGAIPIDGLALRGAHSKAISAIVADEQCVRGPAGGGVGANNPDGFTFFLRSHHPVLQLYRDG
jgi:hypothetical protein